MSPYIPAVAVGATLGLIATRPIGQSIAHDTAIVAGLAISALSGYLARHEYGYLDDTRNIRPFPTQPVRAPRRSRAASMAAHPSSRKGDDR